jgi:membrane protein DedA with SNARE-associated domain
MESLDVLIRAYGYPALFVGMLIEQFVPPMPGEPLLLGAGALAGTGHLRLWLAATIALAGTVVGDLVWYEIGRRGGHRVLKWMCRLSIEPDTCVRARGGYLCTPRRERALDRKVPAGSQ